MPKQAEIGMINRGYRYAEVLKFGSRCNSAELKWNFSRRCSSYLLINFGDTVQCVEIKSCYVMHFRLIKIPLFSAVDWNISLRTLYENYIN